MRRKRQQFLQMTPDKEPLPPPPAPVPAAPEEDAPLSSVVTPKHEQPSQRMADIGRARFGGGPPGMMRRPFDPRLLEGPIIRSLFLLAFPIMGANILQIAYQIVD